jgi:hypothetical protein
MNSPAALRWLMIAGLCVLAVAATLLIIDTDGAWAFFAVGVALVVLYVAAVVADVVTTFVTALRKREQPPAVDEDFTL